MFDDIEESKQLDNDKDDQQHGKIEEEIEKVNDSPAVVDEEELKRQKYIETDKKMR